MKLISKKLLAVAATGLVLSLGGVAGAQSYPVHDGGLSIDGSTPGSGSVPSYSAGEPRHLTGTGFQPGATVAVTIESVPLTLGVEQSLREARWRLAGAGAP